MSCHRSRTGRMALIRFCARATRCQIPSADGMQRYEQSFVFQLHSARTLIEIIGVLYEWMMSGKGKARRAGQDCEPGPRVSLAN